MKRVGIGLAIASALLAGLTMPALAAAGPDSCPAGQIRTASGCESFAAAGRQVRAIVEGSMREQDLRAALVRVDVGERTLAAVSPGESMAGVPATLRMHFRIGSIVIPYIVDLALQLQERGRLSLDDPVSKWLPDLPNADQVTLRMLASATSGYPDWIQGNDEFLNEVYADPFRQWTGKDLLQTALGLPFPCDPGDCFHYAHTNYLILAKVIQQVTGQSLGRLMRTRIFRPIGLRHTEISALPAIDPPVLHSYIGLRGFYEDATYWSPTWGISQNLLLNSTIGDLIRAAKALGTTELVSAQSQRQRVAPVTVGLPVPNKFSDDLYFGLGVLVSDSWLLQNPHENGFNSISAYLPSRQIAVALSVTEGPRAVDEPNRQSENLLNEISAYLTPNHQALPPSP